MKASFVLLIVLMLIGGNAACTRTVYTPVESTASDSLYRSTARRDTIFMLDSVRVEVRGDSVKETRQRTLYRTVTLTDTVREVSVDTVKITIPPQREKGDASRWRLPVIIAVTLLACLVAVRKITRG